MDNAIKEAAQLLLPDETFKWSFNEVVRKLINETNRSPQPFFSARIIAIAQKQDEDPEGFTVFTKQLGQLTPDYEAYLSQAGQELAEDEFPLLMALFVFEGTRKVSINDVPIEQPVVVVLAQSLDGRSVRCYLPIDTEHAEIDHTVMVGTPTEPLYSEDRDYAMDLFFRAYVNHLGGSHESTQATEV